MSSVSCQTQMYPEHVYPGLVVDCLIAALGSWTVFGQGYMKYPQSVIPGYLGSWAGLGLAFHWSPASDLLRNAHILILHVVIWSHFACHIVRLIHVILWGTTGRRQPFWVQKFETVVYIMSLLMACWSASYLERHEQADSRDLVLALFLPCFIGIVCQLGFLLGLAILSTETRALCKQLGWHLSLSGVLLLLVTCLWLAIESSCQLSNVPVEALWELVLSCNIYYHSLLHPSMMNETVHYRLEGDHTFSRLVLFLFPVVVVQ